MNQIDQLISQLILDARNGKTGLTDTYRTKFREVLDNFMVDKNRMVELELSNLVEHATAILDKYS